VADARATPASTAAYAEQVRMLYAGVSTAVLANIANAAILTYLLWEVSDRSSLKEWLTAMVLLQLGRFVLARYYRATPKRPNVVGGHRKGTRWDRWYLAGVATTGSMWGLAGYSLFPHQSPEHQLALIFILGGTVAGGTALLAAVWSAFPLFALPALLPLTVTFFTMDGPHSTAMGVLTLIYLAALLNVARLIHATIDSSITLRFGNEELVADLHAKTGELTQINQLLRTEIDQRTDAQEQLQNQLFFLQELMDAIPSPVFHKDTRGVYRGCNKAFETLVGRPRSNIIGRTAFEVFPRELAESLTRKDRELLDRGSLQALELDLPSTDGTIRRMLAHRVLYHNPVGKVLGVIGALLDVTERKKS
jgi:PAS domain S-box-containing protein